MSDWKRDAAARRDERQTKAPEQRPARVRKSTRAWCRGKKGIEHRPECRDYQEVKRWMGGAIPLPGWKVLVCTVCGKELDTYCPSRWRTMDPPDWVK